MAQSNKNGHSHLKGWGTDLDHARRPAYPKERTPPRLENVPWKQPAQQRPRVPIFHSTEREGITPVFGSSVPPSGLSGLIRRGAFRLSENDLRHWLLLLFADRVNVVEGIIDDLRKSKRARVIAGGLLALGVIGWWTRRRR